MFGQIEDLVRKALDAHGNTGQFFNPGEPDEMFDDIFGDYDQETRVDLIRDLLLDYAYGKADRESTVKAVCQYAKADQLNIVELIGEVDELKENRNKEL